MFTGAGGGGGGGGSGGGGDEDKNENEDEDEWCRELTRVGIVAICMPTVDKHTAYWTGPGNGGDSEMVVLAKLSWGYVQPPVGFGNGSLGCSKCRQDERGTCGTTCAIQVSARWVSAMAAIKEARAAGSCRRGDVYCGGRRQGS